MLSYAVRPQLVKILSWKIGLDTDFSVSVGKSAKYMYRWLPADVWERFLRTYGGTLCLSCTVCLMNLLPKRLSASDVIITVKRLQTAEHGLKRSEIILRNESDGKNISCPSR